VVFDLEFQSRGCFEGLGAKIISQATGLTGRPYLIALMGGTAFVIGGPRTFWKLWKRPELQEAKNHHLSCCSHNYLGTVSFLRFSQPLRIGKIAGRVIQSFF
jgi:hypothetical protein